MEKVTALHRRPPLFSETSEKISPPCSLFSLPSSLLRNFGGELPYWVLLGCSWALLECSWGPLGVLLGSLCFMLRAFRVLACSSKLVMSFLANPRLENLKKLYPWTAVRVHRPAAPKSTDYISKTTSGVSRRTLRTNDLQNDLWGGGFMWPSASRRRPPRKKVEALRILQSGR